MSGGVLGLAGAVVVAVAWVHWWRLLQAVRVPHRRAPHLAVMALGVVLGVAALARGPGPVGGVAAGLAILGGGAFLGLRLQSAQDRHGPAVAVGDPILDFSAPDANGEPFHLASLRGRPFLLKFFRGHW